MRVPYLPVKIVAENPLIGTSTRAGRVEVIVESIRVASGCTELPLKVSFSANICKTSSAVNINDLCDAENGH